MDQHPQGGQNKVENVAMTRINKNGLWYGPAILDNRRSKISDQVKNLKRITMENWKVLLT